MAFEVNVTEADQVFLGEDKEFVFPIYQAGTTVRQIQTGVAVPQDVTGWACEWVLRAFAADVTAVITKTTAGGGVVLTTPASGVITVIIADTDTEALDPGTYHHALRRTDDENEVILAFGTVVLRKVAGH